MALVRWSKIVLTLGVAFFGWLGLLNVIAWKATYVSVQMVVSMDGVEKGPPFGTESPLVITAGALFIILCKLSAGAFCSLGAWRMIVAREASEDLFHAAKRPALVGCAIFLFLFSFGFIFVMNGVFFAFETELGRSVSALALQMGAMIAFIMLYLGQRE